MIATIKKCGIEIKYGIGSYDKNPTQLKNNDEQWLLSCHTEQVWFYYDNMWYKANTQSLVDFKNALAKCYSKEQVITMLIDAMS